MATTQPIRDKQQIRALAGYFLKKGELRNHVLIMLGVHTALRISDLLRISWNDVYDFENGRVRTRIDIIEKKTRKLRSISLNKDAVRALSRYAASSAKNGRCLFENAKTGMAISRIQAYRLIRAAAESLKFKIRVSCHSLRKTLGYHAWKNNVPLPVIMDIYNHSSFSVTMRYLGVTQDDKDAVYLGLSLIL